MNLDPRTLKTIATLDPKARETFEVFAEAAQEVVHEVVREVEVGFAELEALLSR